MSAIARNTPVAVLERVNGDEPQMRHARLEHGVDVFLEAELKLVVKSLFEMVRRRDAGLCAFVLTGTIVAARRNMDTIGFVLLGTVTGIGGGTTRDVILGKFPVFWVAEPSYLFGCIAVSVAGFFLVPLVGGGRRTLLTHPPFS